MKYCAAKGPTPRPKKGPKDWCFQGHKWSLDLQGGMDVQPGLFSRGMEAVMEEKGMGYLLLDARDWLSFAAMYCYRNPTNLRILNSNLAFQVITRVYLTK